MGQATETKNSILFMYICCELRPVESIVTYARHAESENLATRIAWLADWLAGREHGAT